VALKDIKARLRDRMQTVAGVTKVYTYCRNLTAEVDASQLMAADGKFHFWQMYRESSDLTDLVVNQEFTEQEDTLVIEGFYGVKDADDSDETFDGIIDAVLQAINNDRRAGPNGTKLNGTVQTAGAPARRSSSRYVMVGPNQVLCHHAEIVIKVTPRYLQ